MRLLQLGENDEVALIEFPGKDVPPYAILSHTWGPDNEEVSFKDISQGPDTCRDKTGYRKLTFCGKQAAKNSLHYFWVDTCCIDKSSSAELAEAINSMFQWYQDAAKCFVYLSDVSRICNGVGDRPYRLIDWKPAFQRSRWHTRGWTLQELLTPVHVEFFSWEGEYLTEKSLIVNELHMITGISTEALKGRPLSEFSLEERMSWTARRQTKREEDAVYCLLGLFDVNIPLIYGEGPQKALIRLHNEIELEETLIRNAQFRAKTEVVLSKLENLFREQEEAQVKRESSLQAVWQADRREAEEKRRKRKEEKAREAREAEEQLEFTKKAHEQEMARLEAETEEQKRIVVETTLSKWRRQVESTVADARDALEAAKKDARDLAEWTLQERQKNEQMRIDYMIAMAHTEHAATELQKTRREVAEELGKLRWVNSQNSRGFICRWVGYTLHFLLYRCRGNTLAEGAWWMLAFAAVDGAVRSSLRSVLRPFRSLSSVNPSR